MKLFWSKFGASRSGSVAVQIALMLTVLIGFAALGAEVTYFYYKQRQMQAASDAAAFGGAVALMSHHPADFTAEVRAIAANAGFTNGVDGVTLTVNNPPASGNYASNANAVEVLITQPFATNLIKLFYSSPFTLSARAVALGGAGGGLYCVLTLDSSAANAVTVTNNAVIANPNCGVAVNSSSSSALIVNNNGVIKGPVSVTGQWSLANNAVLSGSPSVEGAPPVADPYANVQIQTPPACTAQSGTLSGTSGTLSGGHFCNGFNFINNAVVTLGAGTYYIDSQLVVSNGVTVNATAGVTLIVNGNYAIDISNNSTLNLTAPETGTYAGFAFLNSRSATSTIQQTFGNNVTLNILGIVYFPNQTINFNNNSTAAKTRCTELIGRIVNLSNNVYLNNDCAGTGVLPIGGSSSKMVE